MTVMQTALNVLLSSGVTLGIVRYAGPHLLARNLEAFKAKLQRDNQRDIEAYKTTLAIGAGQQMEQLKAQLQAVNSRDTELLRGELARTATEHRERFSRLQEKRVDALADLHRKMVLAEIMLRQEASGAVQAGSKYRLGELAIEAIRDSIRASLECHLYADAPLRARLDDYRALATSLWIDLQYGGHGDDKTQVTTFIDAFTTTRGKLPDVRAAIEEHVQRLLGVDEPRGIAEATVR